MVQARDLADVALLGAFPPHQLDQLAASAVERTFAAGDAILRFGDAGDFLGIVRSGAVRVCEPDPHGAGEVTALLGPGECFGEMSLLTAEPVSADVFSEGETTIICLPHAALSPALAACTEARTDFVRLITSRLRQAEADASYAERISQAKRRMSGIADVTAAASGEHLTVLALRARRDWLRYGCYDTRDHAAESAGSVQGIGGSQGDLVTHTGRREDRRRIPAPDLKTALEAVAGTLGERPPDVVAHFVAHGGDRAGPAVIDDALLASLREYEDTAPLDQAYNLETIAHARRRWPQATHMAIFDTAFHRNMPDYAAVYGLPHELCREAGIRRYGFYGLSHEYAAHLAASRLKRHISELKLVTCHLGDGASLCAIDHGRSVDTSMGFSTLGGLLMGSRSGDLDPAVLLHLMARQGLSPADLRRLLAERSGLLGISGTSGNMLEIVHAAELGDKRALLAEQAYCYQIRKALGAYLAVLGEVDAVVFTGGIGVWGPAVRARVCRGVAHLGFLLDHERNRADSVGHEPASLISDDRSPLAVLVVPGDESRMIAAQALRRLHHRDADAVVRDRADIPIPIGISAHHVHLSRGDCDRLFGRGHELAHYADLTQPGQFAAREQVTLIGPKGEIDRVRVLAPLRHQTQVEISRTEEFELGIDAPIRNSGDLEGTPGLILEGSAGRIELDQGVICACRHIHLSPADALTFSLRDQDVVRVRVPGERPLIFGGVHVRISPDYLLELHLDTDEANAAELTPPAVGYLDGVEQRA